MSTTTVFIRWESPPHPLLQWHGAVTVEWNELLPLPSDRDEFSIYVGTDAVEVPVVVERRSVVVRIGPETEAMMLPTLWVRRA